jgi:hypothetical protein
LFYFNERALSFYEVDIGMVATGCFSAGNTLVATIPADAPLTVHHFGKGESCSLFANSLYAGEEKGVRQEVLGQGSPQEANYSGLAYDFRKTHLQV